MATVDLKQVTKRYGTVDVVHPLDLKIESQEFVVLVGPSGCGKSTTLRMVAGLEEVSGGQILIENEEIQYRPPKERGIAMVFQSYALYPHMNIFENMSFGLKLRGMGKAEIKKRVEETAEILELTPYLQRKPADLSGGQRQRVAIGRALVQKPRVFLFDEPLSNLDAQLRGQMRVEIKKLHQQIKTTTIYVTHDQVEAMTLADRIVIMNKGRIEQVGTPEDVFERPVNTFVAQFIGHPSMNLFRLPVQRKADKSILGAGGLAVPVPPKYREAMNKYSSSEVIVGMRPGDIYFDSSQSAEDAIWQQPAEVTLVEPLGGRFLVTLKVNGHSFLAEIEGRQSPRAGDHVTMCLELSHLHLFNVQNEKSLNESLHYEGLSSEAGTAAPRA